MEIDDGIRNAIIEGGFTAPTVNQKIFKDQCAYCFKDPLGKDGLYISSANYHAYCREHAELYANSTGNRVFFQYESTKVIVEERTNGEPTNKMKKLTIDADPKYEFDDRYCLVLHPDYDKKYTSFENLEEMSLAIQTIANCTSAERLALLSSTNNAWDSDIKLITKHLNLEQHNNGKTLSLTSWKCEEEGCGLEENLWVNLTDGAVRCGRSQFVSEGQKTNGNGHMQEYYSATGYPLVVKLGTISSNLETIDVYSYDEDDAVLNPNLEQHLKHFGLDPAKMEKTAKSTMEMEMDMNEKWEWARCTEDGAVLEPIYGPGYTGLINVGSSCYMNSVLQALLQVDAFRSRYGEGALQTLVNCPIDNLHNDFNAQFSKVIRAMLSGDYSSEEDPTHNGIKPLQFKRVAAGNHPDFSTSRQQDVEEYIRFLFEKISQNSRNEVVDPVDSFRFQTCTRLEDMASNKVKYREQEEVILRLPIPEAIMQPIPDTEGRFSVDTNAAIHACFDAQFVDGYKSPVTGEEKGATNTLSMKTFPDYLFFQVSKFTYTDAGVQKKLDIELEVSDELDLSQFRSHGKKDDEEELPEEPAAAPKPAEIPANVRAIAQQLMAMGFNENSCYRAAFYSNGNSDVASNWLMEHLEDADINDPFVMPDVPAKNDVPIDPTLVTMIVEMGFSEHQAKYALKQVPTVAEAVDWLFSNMDSIPAETSAGTGQSSDAPEPSATESANQKVFKDGNEKYKLIGMITHMGSSPHCGHYVAHMLKDGKWVLFNDEKVALSQDPPKKLAYIYLYKRVD